jgi:hypothetical protein
MKLAGNDWIEWQQRQGEPHRINEMTITPVAQALTIRWPGGGFVWNRPVGLLIERNGQVERRPVQDWTRLLQVGLLLLGLVGGLLLATGRRRRKARSK